MFQAVRGASDLLPTQLPGYRRLEQKALELAETYGFQEIRTPYFEKADLFTRGLGVMAGLVERELWTFQDKHGQKLALRADLTPCVVRAYQQHLSRSGLNRLFYLGPVFLLGKEGAEPSRQAQQFGVEVLGQSSPAIDAELMVMALHYCEVLGLDEVTLEMNSLGCDKCRPAYYDALREFFSARQSELCSHCRRRYRNHPSWVLSCPEASCQALANLAPAILGYLCQDCKGHFHSLKQLIQELEIQVSFNHRLVRDVEYYSSSTFRLTAQGRTLATGGRYDGLAASLGGSELPAAGFAFYLDELVSLLSQDEAPSEGLDFVFLPEGAEAVKALLPIALRLRKAGARVEVITSTPAGQTPEARWQVRLAENNALRGQIDILDSDSRQLEKCNQERLLARLEHLLGLGQREESEGRGARRRLNRHRRDRDPRYLKDEGSLLPAAQESLAGREEEDDSASDEAGRRRKRRRRRRGEGEDGAERSNDEREVVAEASAPSRRRSLRPRRPEEAVPVKVPVPAAEAATSAPIPRSLGLRPSGSRRGREDGPPSSPRESVAPAPRESSASPRESGASKTEVAAKAFIPQLRLGGAKEASPASAVPRASARPARVEVVEERREIAPALGVNWSIKTRLGGESESSGAEPEAVRSSSARSNSAKRPLRRR